jgi:hypothetical protein
LLLEVEDILESPVTEGDKSKFDEIRKKLWALRQEVEQRVLRPAEWFPNWKSWADFMANARTAWTQSDAARTQSDTEYRGGSLGEKAHE